MLKFIKNNVPLLTTSTFYTSFDEKDPKTGLSTSFIVLDWIEGSFLIFFLNLKLI